MMIHRNSSPRRTCIRQSRQRVFMPIMQALESRTLFAADIAIVNASFENRAATTDPGVAKLTGWTVSNGAVANVHNPDSSELNGGDDDGATHGILPAPAAGKQHLFINGPGTVSQTLTATLQAGMQYHISAAVANRLDLTMGTFRASLFAGTAKIASFSGDAESAIPNGSFRSFSAGSNVFLQSSPLVGQVLRIELTEVASGSTTQVDFDNIRVTTTVPADTFAISINNSSFEKTAATHDPGVATLTGWTRSAGAVANVHNPVSSEFFGGDDTGATNGILPPPAAGKQHLFINGAGTVSQTLADGLIAGRTYKLTVAVGNRGDLVMERFRISLFAGNTRIATVTGDGEALTQFNWKDFSATSSAFASGNALIGQKLRIELTNLNSKIDPAALQVDFDNVRLTSTRAT